MPYDPQTGEFKPYTGQNNSASVSQRVTGLMAQQNPYMRQARTQGRQAANRRGLLNSSMGVQAAQTAAIGAAVPIASQEAQQANQRILQGQQIASQENIARMNTAAQEREVTANLVRAFDQTYSQQVATVMNNKDIPASVRQQYFTHAAEMRNSNLALVEQLYGIDLKWDTPFAPSGSGGNGKSTGATTQQVIQRQNSQIKELEEKNEDAQRQSRVSWYGTVPPWLR